MIVAHLSDLHLGFRAYGRIDRGADMRERDVAAAFERAVQAIIRIGPEVVVVSGDVFDRPDPPAAAVVALARGLEALRSSLPETPVLMVAGPRDTPRRSGDPGALAVLDTFSNVEAATGLTRSILIDRLDLHACLVPSRAMVRPPSALPEADPRKRWNLLVVHGSVDGASGDGIHVDPGEWDYVALGGEHRRRALGERIGYSGALERVALDPWDEATDEKGFLTVHLESGHAEFHPIAGRPVVALAPVKVGHADPDRMIRRVREVTQEVPGGIDGKIVRLRLQGAHPHDLLALQGEQLTRLRQQALHLTVEAGRDLRVPAEAWLPADAPRLLREAVTAELDRDGMFDRAAAAVIERWMPDDLAGELGEPHGAIDSMDGEVPGLGRVSTSIPLGLTGIFGGGGRARRAVAELLFRIGKTGRDGAVRRLWSGEEGETLDGALRRGIDAVAERRGLALLDTILERIGDAIDLDAPSEKSSVRDRPSRGAVRVDPEQVAAEFRAAERELRALRADVAEADGDLEVSTMDWLRERQDAETTLFAYRDRARELRARLRRMESAGPEAPCPTCGRVLQSHYEEVLGELREEWESVVQDGSWWKSRWGQLELKPTHLQELEGRSLRLHAALEAGSERVELLRARLSDLDETRASRPSRISQLGGPEGAVADALRRVRAARLARASDVLLDRASRFVCRLSGGRILAVTRDGDLAQLQGSSGVLTPVSEEDLAVGRVSIRLAAASLVAASGRVLASLPLEEPFDRLDEEARIRTLVLAKGLLQEIPRIVLFTRGEAVDARPELFDYILEVRDEGAMTGPALSPVAAGRGRISLKQSVHVDAVRVSGG